MTKTMSMFSGKILMPLTVTALIMAGCASNDTNPATTTGSDTSMMHADTMMSDHTMVEHSDTTAIVNGDTSAKSRLDASKKMIGDTAAKAKSGKAKKLKVSIVAPDQKANTAAMEMDKEGYYKNTEILPAFPGGQKALERFFEDNIVYPDAATENNAEGTVKLSFAVDENGKIYNPVATSTPIGYGIEEEAIRVFKKMPTWTPGRIKGKNVKTRYTLPIRFQMY
ncbi:MAG: energy transducer TonB [Ferruginibacter sp.]